VVGIKKGFQPYDKTQMRVTAASPCQSMQVSNATLGTSGHQISTYCIWLASYDILLVFYSDHRFRWNCYWITSQQNHNPISAMRETLWSIHKTAVAVLCG